MLPPTTAPDETRELGTEHRETHRWTIADKEVTVTEALPEVAQASRRVHEARAVLSALRAVANKY